MPTRRSIMSRNDQLDVLEGSRGPLGGLGGPPVGLGGREAHPKVQEGSECPP